MFFYIFIFTFIISRNLNYLYSQNLFIYIKQTVPPEQLMLETINRTITINMTKDEEAGSLKMEYSTINLHDTLSTPKFELHPAFYVW
jgi:hypothetical protein